MSSIAKIRPKPRPYSNECVCADCWERFSTERSFDMHRAGRAQDRRCVRPSLVVDKNGNARLTRSAAGLWRRSGKHPREMARESLSVRGKLEIGHTAGPNSP